MQTFLPYPDFDRSVSCLDRQRLCKQRLEAMQIYNAIMNNNRWRNHPAVLMWHGYTDALQLYMNKCIKEWIRRGYKNNMLLATVVEPVEMPTWFGDDRFHASHRANLLRKYPEWYSQFGWIEPDNLPYYWPTKCV